MFQQQFQEEPSQILRQQEPQQKNDTNFNKIALGTAAGAAALSMLL